MQKDTYTAEHIQVQEGLSAVRKRPGMYIGSTDSDGLHHLVYEIVNNSIDEALAGHCDKILVTIHADNSITVEDNGRGIPIDTHSDNLSALEIVMTKLHSGGKFSKDAYKISGGLHGVGCAVVNALSEWCTVSVHRDSQLYRQKFCKGDPTSKLEHVSSSEKQGTSISFLPDASIFTDTQTFDFEKLAYRFKELAFLNKNILIRITDERDSQPKSKDFYSKVGISDFLLSLSKDKKLLETPVVVSEQSDQSELEIVLTYVQGQETIISAFVNSIYTKEGGTHLEGFKSALTKTINKYLKQNDKLLKQLKGASLTGADTQAGLFAVLSLKIPHPTFSGQTKTRLSNSEIKGFTESTTSEALSEFLDHNLAMRQVILEKCVRSSLARIESQKAYDNTLRKTPLGSSSLPGKLVDCLDKNPENSEVFLVEGDSAGGTAKQGRDSKIQAILPLFGKPSNVEKMRGASIHKISSNAKLQPIIATLGTNIASLFDITKLRYHKVIIMADADVDGSHIRTLLLTFFFRFMKPLVENGNLYIAVPPLFRIKHKNEFQYVYTEKERLVAYNEYTQKYDKKTILITRYKGLGEMNADELWNTTMDPQKRKLLQVTIEDAILADETFTLLLGEEVQPRREFIERNAQKVSNLDI